MRIVMPSGKIEKCSNPSTCRRHSRRIEAAFRTNQATSKLKVVLEGRTFPPVDLEKSDSAEPIFILSEKEFDDNKANNLLNFVLSGTGKQKFPEALESTVAENQWIKNGSSWVLNKNSAEKLSKWYWSQPNAEDKKGILSYCRSKGLETTGLTPFEAIVRQLDNENPGRRNTNVERSSEATVEELPFFAIKAPAVNHYESIEERAPIKAVKNSKEINGVVYLKENGSYILIDGYHRLKWAVNRRKKKGLYIVLS